MGKFIDLTGKKFGRWTVKHYSHYEKGKSRWICECSCGTTRGVRSTSLLSGISVSCGCFQKENMSKIQKKKWKPLINENVCMIPLGNSDKMAIIDTEDFPKVQSFGWFLNSRGYPATLRNKKMHTVIKGPVPDNMVTDHINRDKLDNRKSNLRFTTYTGNSQNSGIRSTNSTGTKFISYVKRRKNKYQYLVRVVDPVTKIRHHLGFYDDIENAIKKLQNFLAIQGNYEFPSASC